MTHAESALLFTLLLILIGLFDFISSDDEKARQHKILERSDFVQVQPRDKTYSGQVPKKSSNDRTMCSGVGTERRHSWASPPLDLISSIGVFSERSAVKEPVAVHVRSVTRTPVRTADSQSAPEKGRVIPAQSRVHHPCSCNIQYINLLVCVPRMFTEIWF